MSTRSEGEGASSHRIVVGVDGSESAMRALDWAASEAERSGAVLDVQTAYEPGYVFVTKDEIQHCMDELVKEAAARVAKLAPGVATTSGTHEMKPAEALIEASEGADLLVVGSRGLGGFKGLLLGSVSEQCSHHAGCPVTIVR
jgi:nucleotide-binding universal stress UspA family protein